MKHKNHKNFLDINSLGLLNNVEIAFSDLTPAKQHEIIENLSKNVIPNNVDTDLIEDMPYEDWISLIVLPQIMETTWKGQTDEISNR